MTLDQGAMFMGLKIFRHHFEQYERVWWQGPLHAEQQRWGDGSLPQAPVFDDPGTTAEAGAGHLLSALWRLPDADD